MIRGEISVQSLHVINLTPNFDLSNIYKSSAISGLLRRDSDIGISSYQQGQGKDLY
jgi:hypothetical protein